jgi:hypothetical protein
VGINAIAVSVAAILPEVQTVLPALASVETGISVGINAIAVSVAAIYPEVINNGLAIASVAASIAAGGGGIDYSYFSVPTADDVENAYERDVIGNKTDTVSGDSLIAIGKQNLASVASVRSDIAAVAVSVAAILPEVQTVLPALASVETGISVGINAIAVSVAAILPEVQTVLPALASVETGISVGINAIAVSVAAIYPEVINNGTAIASVAASVVTIMPALSSIASGISSESPVPVQDTADNTYTSDVVGNKTDTTGGTSLVSIGKQILTSVASARSDIAAVAVSVAALEPIVSAIAVSVAAIYPAVADNAAAIASVAASVVTIMPALSSIASAGGGETPVPVQDSADNIYTSDVVGNKTDTIAGDSLVSYSKIITANVSSVATSVQAMASVVTSVADFFSVLDTAITSVATSTATLNPAITSVAVAVSSIDTSTFDSLTVPAQNSADNVYMRDVVGNKTDTSAGNSLYSFAQIFNNYFHVQQRVYPNLASPVQVTSGTTWVLGASVALVSAGMIPNAFVIDYIMATQSTTTVTYQINLYADGNLIAEGGFTPNTYAYCPCKTSVIAASTEVRMQLAASASSYTQNFKIAYHYYN